MTDLKRVGRLSAGLDARDLSDGIRIFRKDCARATRSIYRRDYLVSSKRAARSAVSDQREGEREKLH